MTIVAVIPARGGSKRIPRKNIKLFGGKPVMTYSITAALESGVFDRVLVSTDDSEIADIARRHGAEVPFVRPAAISDDHAGTDDVMAHALRELARQGYEPEFACCIYSTAPFMRAADIKTGLDQIRKGSRDYVFSATSYPHSIFRAFAATADTGVRMFMPEHYHTRSQDLPEAWHDAAQFYWGTRQAWIEGRTLFASGSDIVALPRWRVQDIDTTEDWLRAEIMLKVMQGMPDALE